MTLRRIKLLMKKEELRMKEQKEMINEQSIYKSLKILSQPVRQEDRLRER